MYKNIFFKLMDHFHSSHLGCLLKRKMLSSAKTTKIRISKGWVLEIIHTIKLEKHCCRGC